MPLEHSCFQLPGQVKSQLPDSSYEYLLTQHSPQQQQQQRHGLKTSEGVSSDSSLVIQQSRQQEQQHGQTSKGVSSEDSFITTTKKQVAGSGSYGEWRGSSWRKVLGRMSFKGTVGVIRNLFSQVISLM
jgi:recombinational DNA repair ATPase RecF